MKHTFVILFLSLITSICHWFDVTFTQYIIQPNYGSIFTPIQTILATFLSPLYHGNLLHFFFNGIVLVVLSNLRLHTTNQLTLLYSITAIFLGIIIHFFSHSPTIWLSGYINAIIGSTVMLSWKINKEEAKWGVLFLWISCILPLLNPEISFIGHAWGAFCGWVYGYILWIIKKNP
jgi:membrane associated rhomboid family serine protease